MAIYVVGDIQGCFDALKCALKKVSFNIDRDILWSVGDIVNRGPKSLKTLRFLYERRDNLVMVLGNHDLHLLAVASGVRKTNRQDTISKILDVRDSKPLIKWLHQQPLIHCELGYTMVHAGIPPQWSVKEARIRAREVESALKGPDPIPFLQNMYGDYPNIWSDDLQGEARLRLITNYLTRMRYCTKEGQLDLVEKGVRKNCGEMKAWFSYKKRKASKNKILFGHWASINGITDTPYAVALDTGCVWGGKLSLYSLESGRMTRCNCG